MTTAPTSLARAFERLCGLVLSSYSEFYRRKYAESEAVKRILQGEAHETLWAEVPFLTREELQSAPYYDRLFVPENDVGIMRVTSGTSGRGLLLMPRLHDAGSAHSAKLFNDFFFEKKFKRYATFSGAHYQQSLMFKDLYGLDSIHLDPGNMKSAAMFVEAYRPDIIAGFSYAIAGLYPSLQKNVIENVRALYLFGERCSAEQWKLFQGQFPQAVVIEDYASVDAQTTVGFPCAEIIKNKQQYIHPIPEYVYAEVINLETGDVVVSEGSVGELVITVLRPTVTPLIRYRTGDGVRIISNSCACGTQTPVLSVEGRLGMDKLRFRGGELNLAEIERVFRVIKHYGVGSDFQVHFQEVRKGRVVFPRVTIHMQWDTGSISASRLAGIIAKELRVLEDKTYDLGVRNGEFEPLSIVLLPEREVNKKYVRIVRDDV